MTIILVWLLTIVDCFHPCFTF